MDFSGQEENFRYKIYNEFKQIEDLLDEFRNDFGDAILELIQEYYPLLEKDDALSENIGLYANEIINAADSVTYKDQTYPVYRIKEELKAMTRIVVKEPSDGQDPEFIKRIHKKAKEILVNHFPQVIDLSGDGFRLLEKYTKMYNWEFITNFYHKE